MSWAEIKKAVNSDLDVPLDDLIKKHLSGQRIQVRVGANISLSKCRIWAWKCEVPSNGSTVTVSVNNQTLCSVANNSGSYRTLYGACLGDTIYPQYNTGSDRKIQSWDAGIDVLGPLTLGATTKIINDNTNITNMTSQYVFLFDAPLICDTFVLSSTDTSAYVMFSLI